MAKYERNIQQNHKQISSLRVDNLIGLGFRITMILFGLALLFVAGIYYGIINP